MFVDRALIILKAGDGGHGHVSFRREKAEPKGGPNGGNGGKGGDIVFVADEGMTTLYDFRHRAQWEAEPGERGGQKQCTGKDAPDLVIHVPPGTMIFDQHNGVLRGDLKPGDRIVVAKGGRGGFGNEYFKSSTNQTPRTATPGEPGEQYHVRLELKLIADVGIVGLPNAGKSTLLSVITAADPKIAAYPFTTLSPQLGIAEVDNLRRIVFADIPGLIEGASSGAGLGHDFLRHIERTRIIVHLVDASPLDNSSPAENYRIIREELRQYSQQLADKPELIVISKTDLLPDEEYRNELINEFCAELNLNPTRDLMTVSSAAREGLQPLLERLWLMLHPSLPKVDGWKP
jgi:GTPase